MRHGYASDTQADLSLRALYTYLTSLVTRLLVRVFTVQYNNLFQPYYQNCHFMGRCSDCANSFVLFRLCKYCKRHAYIMPKSPSNSVDPDNKCGSRGGHRGSGPPPPGKPQVIWVSIGNKQLDPPPPLEKVGPPPPCKRLDSLWNLEK